MSLDEYGPKNPLITNLKVIEDVLAELRKMEPTDGVKGLILTWEKLQSDCIGWEKAKKRAAERQFRK